MIGLLRILRSHLSPPLILGLLLYSAAPVAGQSVQDLPVVEANLQWVGSVANGDGTYAHDFDVTLVNPGLDALTSLQLELIDAQSLLVRPADNVLAVGTLGAGETLSRLWVVISLTDMPSDLAGNAYPVLAAEADDGFGARQGVAVLDAGGTTP